MSHHLPVAVHVARREAGRMIAGGLAATASWDRFLDGLMRGVLGRYGSGRKLSAEGLAAVAADVRAALVGLSPVSLHEAALPPSRAHPKGEAHEFLALARYGNDAYDEARTGFVGLRVHASRRRVTIDQEFVGLDVTRHALERAIEREVVPGDGLRRVEAALAAHAGLVVAWRWAMVSRNVGADVALPLGEGLLLGRIDRVPVGGLNLSYRLDRDGAAVVEGPQNDLQVAYGRDGWSFLPFLGSTVVGEDEMRVEQCDLRDALRAYAARNADFLADIGAYASWASPALHPRDEFEALRGRLDDAAAGLDRVLSHPALRGAIMNRIPQGGTGRHAYPAAIMGAPRERLARVGRGLLLAA